jgi:hypothetical protein
VTGAVDAGYSIYVDIMYMDGTPLWGQTVRFDVGTHDWQFMTKDIAGTKPIKSMIYENSSTIRF